MRGQRPELCYTCCYTHSKHLFTIYALQLQFQVAAHGSAAPQDGRGLHCNLMHGVHRMSCLGHTVRHIQPRKGPKHGQQTCEWRQHENAESHSHALRIVVGLHPDVWYSGTKGRIRPANTLHHAHHSTLHAPVAQSRRSIPHYIPGTQSLNIDNGRRVEFVCISKTI